MTEKNIYQRILSVMEELDYIQKGEKKAIIGPQQYRFVSHDQVTAAIHPLLVKHGIVVFPTILSSKQDGNRTEISLQVRYVIVDKPEDCIVNDWLGYGIDGGDKGPGKAVSYAFKYAILKTFCLETGDDPDEQQDAVHESVNVPKQQQKKLITEAQLKFLNNLLDCDAQYKAGLVQHLAGRGISSLDKIPFEWVDGLIKGAQAHKENIIKQKQNVA